MSSKITISEDLFRFISEHTNDYYALQLILFFAEHPYAQFNELAIIHALNQDGGRRCLQQALRILVDKGMIKTCVDSNVHVYSLPENMRSLVLELARLNPSQRKTVATKTNLSGFSEKKGGTPVQGNASMMLSQAPKIAVTDRHNSAIFNQEKQLINQ